MLIRQATRDDVAAIVGIFNDDELNPSTHASADDYLDAFDAIDGDPDNRVFVAVDDGEIVGTFQLTFIAYLMRRGRKVAQVESVHVAADHRGRGIGEEMMRWAIDEARRTGCTRLQLTSNKARSRAHAFYERLGFDRTHEGFKLYL